MLTIQENQEQDFYILTLAGDFKIQDIPKLESAIGSTIRQGFMNIAIIFKLTSISCSIIIPLMRLRQLCMNGEGKIIFANTPDVFRFILYITKLSENIIFKEGTNLRRLVTEDPKEEALRLLKQKSQGIPNTDEITKGELPLL